MAFLTRALDIYLGHEWDFCHIYMYMYIYVCVYVCILKVLKIFYLFLPHEGMSSIEKGPYQLWIVLNHNCRHPESLAL